MSKIKEHFDRIALEYDFWKRKNWYYYKNLKSLYGEFIPVGSKVLEVGCGTGDILTFLKPTRGVGFDISEEMIRIAKEKHGSKNNLFFYSGTAESLDFGEKFDFVILADVIEHLDNVNSTMKSLKKFCHENTRVIISMINPLWEIPFWILEKLNLKMPEGPHNRISINKLKKILKDNNFSIKKEGYRIILPSYIPYLSDFLNKYFYKIPILNKLGLIYFCISIPK